MHKFKAGGVGMLPHPPQKKGGEGLTESGAC